MNEPHLVHGIFTTRVKTSQGQLPDTILMYTLQVRNRLENKEPSQITPGVVPSQVNQIAALLGLTIKIGQTADPGSQITMVGAEICITQARLCVVFYVVSRITGLCSPLAKNNFLKVKTLPRWRGAGSGLLCVFVWTAEAGCAAARQLVGTGHTQKEFQGDTQRHRFRESGPGNFFPWEPPSQVPTLALESLKLVY